MDGYVRKWFAKFELEKMHHCKRESDRAAMILGCIYIMPEVDIWRQPLPSHNWGVCFMSSYVQKKGEMEIRVKSKWNS